jgi:hypothetical protein
VKRWHNETALMYRRWRQELANHDWETGKNYAYCALASPDDAKGISCHCANGIGSMRKNRPYGCSRVRCGICHWEKVFEPKCRNNHRRDAIKFEIEAYN